MPSYDERGTDGKFPLLYRNPQAIMDAFANPSSLLE